MAAGEELLDEAQQAVDALLPSLSPSGKNHVQQDMQTLKQGCASLKSQLDSSLKSHETCRLTWEEFNKELNTLAEWITQTLESLQEKPIKKSTVEEKKDSLDELQVYCIVHQCSRCV
jgi:flagellar biosynthesis chaperone FliJ